MRGALADSVLPRSDGMANVFGRPVAGTWTATRDSLLLSFGAITVVGVHLGQRPQGVWYEYADFGHERTGTLRATRIDCRDRLGLRPNKRMQLAGASFLRNVR